MKRKFSFIIIFLINVLFRNIIIAQPYEPIERVYYNFSQTEGFVYFEGFDFNNYNHLTYPSLQEMLDITYNKLVEHYKSSNKPFVFVGHSQGGLRAIAMTTYLKQRDPELYRNLRGVITVSGIDNGLKLLENRGENTRNK